VLLALSSNQKLGLALAAAAFVVFALVSAMLIPRYRPTFPAGHLGWFIAACVLFTVGMLATVVFVARETGEEEAAAEGHTTPSKTEPTETAETTNAAGGSDPVGKVIFTTNCASCHTLADAGTTGTVGPNLDQAQPDEALVVERVTNGQGVMPPFEGVLTEEEITEVAVYVSAAAGAS
jgi:mono/diheme cytochrome c family protein